MRSKNEEYDKANYQRYLEDWGNYKSDKWKSNSILREEIRSILALGNFSKEELKAIKDIMKMFGFPTYYDSLHDPRKPIGVDDELCKENT